jgi:hypothetical protein
MKGRRRIKYAISERLQALIRDSRSDEALQTVTVAGLVRLLLQTQIKLPIQRVGKVGSI